MLEYVLYGWYFIPELLHIAGWKVKCNAFKGIVFFDKIIINLVAGKHICDHLVRDKQTVFETS